MTDVFFPGFAINQDIVEKDYDKLTEVLLKQSVHSVLKGGWGVAEAKGHHQKLIVAEVGAERRFVNIIRGHADLMIIGA
jgi:hypothetical protein